MTYWEMRPLDPRYWTAYFDCLGDWERDGPIEFRGNAWRSQNDKIISYPYAVVDDFGTMIPVWHGH